MSATDVQLRFAAEFALFLVSLAGVGFAFLRSDLLVVRPIARIASACGFACIAAAALLAGSLIVDDPSTAGVVGLRAAGIVLLAGASVSWRPDRGGRELLRIGLLALAFAEVALIRDDSNTIVDVARFIGAFGIGACLVGASARVISARIAASGAMIVFAVITVVAVALSTIVSDNIEDEALRRYTSRVLTEAEAAGIESGDVLPSAKLIAQVLTSAPSPAAQLALERALGVASATPAQLLAAQESIIDSVQRLMSAYVLEQDPRSGPSLLVSTRGGSVYVPVSGKPAVPDAAAFATQVGDLVEEASTSQTGAQTALVVGGTPLAVAAYPLSIEGESGVAGVLVRTSLLDSTYLEVRRNPIEDEQEGTGLALVDRGGILSSNGAPVDEHTAVALAEAALGGAEVASRTTDSRFLVAAPVQAGTSFPMALVLSVPRTQEDATREDLYRVLFLVAMGAATAALLLAGVAGERIGGGLRRLNAAATAIQAGNLDVRTGVATDDELGELGTAFDSMALSLQNRTAELNQVAADEAALRARLEAVVGGMGEALVAVDADGVITDFNAAAERLFDLPAREALGRRVHEVMRLRSDDGRDQGRRLARPVISPWSQAGNVALANGDEVPVVVSAGTLRGPGNEVSGAVFVVRDERRERELDRMKTEFLSTISHELRTPLTPIKGFASILQTRDLGRAKVKGFASEISESADQLERVVGQLVNFATVVGGRVTLNPEAIAVRPFVDDAVKRWRARVGAEHKLVRRVPAGVPRLLADRGYLTQSLDELIDNAVKYSPDGGTVVVSAGVIEGPDGPALELAVSDEGVGIPADRVDAIAEDFTQADASATRQYGGLGLGLALANRIARAHGGELVIDSAPGAGSRVAIVLPLDKAKAGRRR